MSLTDTQLSLAIVLPVTFVLLLVGWYLAARHWPSLRWGLPNPKIPGTNWRVWGEENALDSYKLDEQLSSYSLSFF
jgi:hypothetical protein